jgi:hypothetical protein
MTQERRAHKRVPDDLGIAVSVMAEPGPIPHLASPAFHLTRDISEGGLRFRHHCALKPGTLLKVYVALKSPLMTLTHFARVRWTQSVAGGSAHDVGIEFADSPAVDVEAWCRYVRQLPAMASV